ncbi:cell division protein SepF [Candidatus Blastococcus massiliensis]|uniref:cell division protein SepF n=1 Tax=Candidatus Blastococcus massiliensis TaxID=1470358 RepID=UPI00058E18D0|nr:cell division protein SepF [Candidatus Blastococcus massiliensis]
MAGAMRRMGIYLGLVEDDDPRGYGRYDARQSDHPDADRRYGRYADDHYDDYADGDYPAGYADDELEPADAAPVRAPEPLGVRRVAPARPLGLAPSVGSGGGGGGARISAMGSGPVGAAGLAVREPVTVAEPAPAPALAPQPYRITTLHPRTYNEARVIGERFRDGMPVIMNLTEMDDADAKRLVDFAAGLSFGLRGSIERVTAKVFLLSPQNVDVTAEDKARIREGGFFNQS